VSAVTNAAQPGTPQQAAVAAALVVLERMGLSPADLVAVPRDRAVIGRPGMVAAVAIG
jgi:hypothetical protein